MNAHRALLRLIRGLKRKHLKGLRADMLEHHRAIDPVGCGCTDCLVGDTKPADTQEEYEIAEALKIAR